VSSLPRGTAHRLVQLLREYGCGAGEADSDGHGDGGVATGELARTGDKTTVLEMMQMY
jgi:hypothetical protein